MPSKDDERLRTNRVELLTLLIYLVVDYHYLQYSLCSAILAYYSIVSPRRFRITLSQWCETEPATSQSVRHIFDA